MLLISAWDKSLKASCASMEPLSARRRRRGRVLEAKDGRGRGGVDMACLLGQMMEEEVDLAASAFCFVVACGSDGNNVKNGIGVDDESK